MEKVTENIPHIIYDRATWGAIKSDYNFFQVPLGVEGKTKSDTNLFLAGQLPSENFFVIKQIDVYFICQSPIEYQDFRGAGNWELEIAHESYFSVATIAIIAPHDLEPFDFHGTITDIPKHLSSREIDPPIMLRENTSFGMRYRNPEQVSGLRDDSKIFVTMSGVLLRRAH